MRLNDKNNICPCSVHKLFNVEEVPLPVEAVEDAEWRGRELPDCGPHVLDVPHGGPLPSLVITLITSEQCLVKWRFQPVSIHHLPFSVCYSFALPERQLEVFFTLFIYKYLRLCISRVF